MGFLNNELNHNQQSGDFVKMIKQFFLAMMVCIVSLSQTGCGLSIVQDWQASGGKAITGGGAIAGKDYVSGLKPSENARKYFAKISANGDSPIETVRRTDDSPSKTGVRFVKNGGILIPPGVTISFTNRGYCMDPHLPAPKAGEEYQLIPMTQLIPEDLQGMYKKLVTKASAGDEGVQRNMQHLVWALRTAGTDAAYANNLTKEQKKILDRCGEYPGQFEEFNANAKANSKALKELIGLADSFLNVKIGGVSYKASDLLDPDVGNKKINEHINQLIGMSQHLPVEKSGFNFGEIQHGIYTDVQGTGYMQFRAKIANSTNQPFIYYPTDYVGQVGSPTKNGGMATYATADTTMRQRVTGGNPNDVEAQGEPKQEKTCKHIWQKFEQNGKPITVPRSQDVISERQKYREKYKKEIDKKLRELQTKYAEIVNRGNVPPHLEIGSLIYYDKSTGQIGQTEIIQGYESRDIFEGRVGGFFPKHLGRTVKKGNQWYQYDMDTRELTPCKDEWGSFDRTSKKWSGDPRYYMGNSSEIEIPFNALNDNQIPLAFSHLHRGEENFWKTGYNVNGFSDQDLFIAEIEGISITVVKEGYYDDTTYEPEDQQFYSQSNPSIDSSKEYNDLRKSISKKYIFRCIKCGATR